MAKKKKVQNKNGLSGETKIVHLFYDGTERYSQPAFVGINGMTWMIERGKDVEVPVEVAEVLRQQQMQDNMTAAMIDKIKRESEEALML
jgi:hypothetical protein